MMDSLREVIGMQPQLSGKQISYQIDYVKNVHTRSPAPACVVQLIEREQLENGSDSNQDDYDMAALQEQMDGGTMDGQTLNIKHDPFNQHCYAYCNERNWEVRFSNNDRGHLRMITYNQYTGEPEEIRGRLEAKASNARDNTEPFKNRMMLSGFRPGLRPSLIKGLFTSMSEVQYNNARCYLVMFNNPEKEDEHLGTAMLELITATHNGKRDGLPMQKIIKRANEAFLDGSTITATHDPNNEKLKEWAESNNWVLKIGPLPRGDPILGKNEEEAQQKLDQAIKDYESGASKGKYRNKRPGGAFANNQNDGFGGNFGGGKMSRKDNWGGNNFDNGGWGNNSNMNNMMGGNMNMMNMGNMPMGGNMNMMNNMMQQWQQNMQQMQMMMMNGQSGSGTNTAPPALQNFKSNDSGNGNPGFKAWTAAAGKTEDTAPTGEPIEAKKEAAAEINEEDTAKLKGKSDKELAELFNVDPKMIKMLKAIQKDE